MPAGGWAPLSLVLLIAAKGNSTGTGHAAGAVSEQAETTLHPNKEDCSPHGTTWRSPDLLREDAKFLGLSAKSFHLDMSK